MAAVKRSEQGGSMRKYLSQILLEDLSDWMMGQWILCQGSAIMRLPWLGTFCYFGQRDNQEPLCSLQVW